MANIAKLPSGSAIAIGRPTNSVMAYGVSGFQARVQTHPSGSHKVATLHGPDKAALVGVSETGSIEFVELAQLDATSVQYANRFLASSPKVVILNWRTSTYRLKTRKGGPKVRLNTAVGALVAAAAPTPPVTPTVEVQPSAEVIAYAAESQHTTDKAATITVTAEAVTAVVLPRIPGMYIPPKVKVKSAGRGLTAVGEIVIPNRDYETLQDVWTLRQQGKPAFSLITGPAGTAKTRLVEQFAASMGVPYLKIDAGAVRTADDWSGTLRQDPATKTWAHQWSPFALALRAGVPCVVHVDELTRTESPAALNAFMGLFDESGTLLVPDANDVLRLPPTVMVVATANMGPEFVGTLPLDGAVRQRLVHGIRMEYPAEATEVAILTAREPITTDVAERLVRMATQQRMHRDDRQQYPSGAVISTRILLAIAQRIALGRKPRDVVQSVLYSQFDKGDDAALSVVIDSQFPKTEPKAPPTPGIDATIVTERHWYTTGGPNGACAFPMSNGSSCGAQGYEKVHFGAK